MNTFYVTLIAFGAAAWGACAKEAPPGKQDAAFGGGACTVALTFRADRHPDEGLGEWGDASPMTLFRMVGEKPGDPLLFARILRQRVFVTFFQKNGPANFEITADMPVGTGLWHQAVVTDSGDELALYLDGELFGCHWHRQPLPRFVRMQAGADGGRRVLQGAVEKKAAFFNRCLSEVEVAVLYSEGATEEIRRAARENRQRYEAEKAKAEACPYRALRVAQNALHPLIDQLSVSATAVAWHDAKGRDLLAVGGGMFGSRLALYRFLEMRGGLPVYDAGTTVTSLPSARFQALPSARGTFDLFAVGAGTPFGQDAFVRYVNTGRPGEPAFAPRRVLFGGKPLTKALAGGVSGWSLADINRDGTEDFVYMRTLSLGGDTRFPFEGSPWTGKEQRYAGPGRGYDIRGNWLGSEVIGGVHWAPGLREADGNISFGTSRQVLTRVKDYPLLWKTIGACRAVTVLRLEGRGYLLMAGNIDELMAVELETRGGDVVCGEAHPLLKSGFVLPHTYLVSRISAVDLDGDGALEVLLDGNPGVVAVLKGRRVGEFESVGVAQVRGGCLAAETLTSPCRFDWDDDGRQDLLTGDASGQLLLWPGTADPWTYQSPVAMAVGGVPVKPTAGMNGSIQGSNEKRWGYLKVVAGVWGGQRVVITDDITGRLMLYRAACGGGALQPGIPFTLNGEAFRIAWRSRPALIAGSTGFAGVPHDALLVQDWEGDLACAMPAAPGGTDFRELVKLRYSDGGCVRLCGPAGLWGRGAVTLTDWDADGRLDLLFGTNRSCHQFFSEEMARKEAVPFFLRNVGSNTRPSFAHPKPLRLADGKPLGFGVHNATPWATDLDGDGRPDLLIGAEDGKVYGFLRGDLTECNPSE